jgi:hypothetical protein
MWPLTTRHGPATQVAAPCAWSTLTSANSTGRPSGRPPALIIRTVENVRKRAAFCVQNRGLAEILRGTRVNARKKRDAGVGLACTH